MLSATFLPRQSVDGASFQSMKQEMVWIGDMCDMGGMGSHGHPEKRAAGALGIPWRPLPTVPCHLPTPYSQLRLEKREVGEGRSRRGAHRFFCSLKIIVGSWRKEILSP